MKTEDLFWYALVAFVVYKIVSKASGPTVTVIPPDEPIQAGFNPSDLIPQIPRL